MRGPIFPAERAGLALLAISANSCALETVLGTPDQTWLWMAVPLGGFLFIGGILVMLLRRSHLGQWDMAHEPAEPTTRRILLGTVVAAVAMLVGFVVLNLRVDIDPDQRLWNLGLWALGTILGATLSLFLGLRFGEPSTTRRS